jgi:hypothetical protein
VAPAGDPSKHHLNLLKTLKLQPSWLRIFTAPDMGAEPYISSLNGGRAGFTERDEIQVIILE